MWFGCNNNIEYTENNFLFGFIDNFVKYDSINKEKFVKLIFEILAKSNISKIKNIYFIGNKYLFFIYKLQYLLLNIVKKNTKILSALLIQQ